MTITELKNALIMTGLCAGIDDIDEVVRVYESEDAERRNDWFVTIPFDALLFFHLSFDQGTAENLYLATIAAVETSISLFLMTPEEDRGISEVVSSEEEQYIIPMPGLSTTSGHQQFLTEKDGVYFSCRRNEDLHQVLTEGELDTVPSAYRDYAEPLNEYEERLCLASLGQLLGGLAHE